MTGKIFKGKIVKGSGCYSDLEIPGNCVLRRNSIRPPSDWPDELCRGSLNVQVTEWPSGFSPPNNGRSGAFDLDGDALTPEFLIPGHLIENNRLVWDEISRRAHESSNASPEVRSAANVWRAELELSQDEIVRCWVLRRLGSRVGGGSQLEIVSQERIRDTYGLPEGQMHPVVLKLFVGCGSRS